MCANFQVKRTTLTFLVQIFPKMDLRLEIQKTNAGITISIIGISCVPIFTQNGWLWLSRPKFAPRWILRSEFQKSKSEFGINISKLPCVPIFGQNEQLWIFRPKFREKNAFQKIFKKWKKKDEERKFSLLTYLTCPADVRTDWDSW